MLREFFPAALLAFDDLAAAEALELLGRAPDPVSAARLTVAQITAPSTAKRSPRYAPHPAPAPTTTNSAPAVSVTTPRSANSATASSASSTAASRPARPTTKPPPGHTINKIYKPLLDNKLMGCLQATDVEPSRKISVGPYLYENRVRTVRAAFSMTPATGQRLRCGPAAAARFQVTPQANDDHAVASFFTPGGRPGHEVRLPYRAPIALVLSL
jgi:hypothetical protein